MMNKKPKTALAKLLDNIKQVEEIELPVTENAHYTLPNKREQETKSPSSFWIKDESVNEPLSLVYLNPEECKPWRFADRPEDEMGDIAELARSIKEHGQQEPVLVRPTESTNQKRFEVIFGNRRWRACQHANITMLAIVKSVSDQEAALYQKEENEQRKDLSDYARAKSYKAQLEFGVFSSEAEMSLSLNISRKTLNDLMAFIRVPAELVAAIPNFKHLSRAMAVQLSILAKDATNLEKLIKLGPKIGNHSITTSNLEKYLIGEDIPKKSSAKVVDITDRKGNSLFNMSENPHGLLTIKIHRHLSGKYQIDSLKEMLYNYLVDSKTEGYEIDET